METPEFEHDQYKYFIKAQTKKDFQTLLQPEHHVMQKMWDSKQQLRATVNKKN
jgi:hypothetical protein